MRKTLYRMAILLGGCVRMRNVMNVSADIAGLENTTQTQSEGQTARQGTWHAPLHGVVPPLATPLLDRDTLDVEGLERLTAHILDGVGHGLFVLGPYDSSFLTGLKCALACSGLCNAAMAEPLQRLSEPERRLIQDRLVHLSRVMGPQRGGRSA